MGKFLRFIGILFMGITAIFTLTGGAGTTCVALAAEKYDSMVGIAPYKWLYVIFVLVTIAVGVLMVRATIRLIKGHPDAYRCSIVSLVLGIIVGVIHIAVSLALRGASMPVDGVVGAAVITLIIFLLFRIPGVWDKVNFDKASREESNTAGGAAAIASGLLCFTIQYLMAPTHTMNGGINYGDAFHTSMTLIGWALTLGGAVLVAWANLPALRAQFAWKNEIQASE